MTWPFMASGQGGEHLVEHHPIRDPAAVTPPRMIRDEFGGDRPPSTAWRTGPTGVRSGMLAAGARTRPVISRTSAIPRSSRGPCRNPQRHNSNIRPTSHINCRTF